MRTFEFSTDLVSGWTWTRVWGRRATRGREMVDDEIDTVIGLVASAVDRGAGLEEMLKILSPYIVDGGQATVQAASVRVHEQWVGGQASLGDVALAFKHALATGLFVPHD